MKKITAAAAMILMISGASYAQTDTPTFIAMATSSNQFEIQSSEMAQDKAESEDVKEFASQMIADHTKAGEELKAAVEGSGADAPAEAKMDPKYAEMLQQLEGAGAGEFDALYVQLQTTAHEEAVNLFRGYAEAVTRKR